MSNNAPVILSYGLGVDSTAILLRWINEPSSRDFDLSDLIVITAMTGDEWDITGQHVTDHILPLLREHGIRYIQIARHGLLKEDGVTVLSDTTAPTELFIKGDYKLSDEMIEAGTVPQMGGPRKCSMKAKGVPLDETIARVLGPETSFRHVMGFEANEPGRAIKDAKDGNSEVRTGEYPLITWGWDRAKCEEYIRSITGIDWLKSACVFCPFAISNKAGRERVLDLFRQYPDQAAQALFVEYTSLRFNDRQGLNGELRLIDLIRADGNQAALDALDAKLQATPHATYHVRRIAFALKSDPTKVGSWARSIKRVSEPELLGTFLATEVDALTEVVRTRPDAGPGIEESFVVAPAVVADKQRANFETWWLVAISS